MSTVARIVLLLGLVLAAFGVASAQWGELYATYDDGTNGTTHNTASVGVIKANMFVALISNATRCFMIPYVNADSALGRVGTWEYSPPAGTYKYWADGLFVQVQMERAYCITATPDSFVYVANNDQNHSILVFKFTGDSMAVVPRPGSETIMPYRETGGNGIFGIAVDGAGYIYVCNDTTAGKTDDIKIYPPISQWTDVPSEAPLRTVDLPDGIYKGITVNAAGTAIFVSDYVNRKVLRYNGTRAAGYTQVPGFNFTMAAGDTVGVYNINRPGPMGLAYYNSKNIVAVACDVFGLVPGTHGTYQYGKIHLLNANTGAPISTDTAVAQINQAAWALAVTGTYTNRGDGTLFGNASCYASTWDVKLDEAEELYSQSYFGWTIEKWHYTGSLPTFTGVEPIGEVVPTGFRLEPNYPNPFNPSTRIEFSVPKESFVSLKIFDLLGREVATLVNEEKVAGTYRATFDARGIPSGTYYYSLRAGDFVQTRSMVVVK